MAKADTRKKLRRQLQSVYDGLNSAHAGVFPKKCASCGRVYGDFREFINNTEPVFFGSGLSEVPKEDLSPAVGVYRNCVCCSTLMLVCNDRRDASAAGVKRRELFEQMLGGLTRLEMAPDVARAELLQLFNHGHSAVIEKFLK